MKMNAAAKFHQTAGVRDISFRAALIIEPNEFIDGSTPTPM